MGVGGWVGGGDDRGVCMCVFGGGGGGGSVGREEKGKEDGIERFLMG